MSSFKHLLKATGSLDIVRECLPLNIICYTNFSETSGCWNITITDGDCIWRNGLAERDIEDLSTSVKVLRECLEVGDIKFTSQLKKGKATLSLSHESNSISLELTELPATENKPEMKSLLFTMARHMTDLKSELAKCKNELEETSKRKVDGGESLFPIDTITRSTGGSKTQGRIKKPAGHSLINPSTKRRKAAVGVVFEDDT